MPLNPDNFPPVNVAVGVASAFGAKLKVAIERTARPAAAKAFMIDPPQWRKNKVNLALQYSSMQASHRDRARKRSLDFDAFEILMSVTVSLISRT